MAHCKNSLSISNDTPSCNKKKKEYEKDNDGKQLAN